MLSVAVEFQNEMHSTQPETAELGSNRLLYRVGQALSAFSAFSGMRSYTPSNIGVFH